jgi:hypothetical protein
MLDLTLGNLTTTSAELLSLADGATAINASANSFVNGPMKKRGDDPFLFPIGEGLEYAPIEISAGGTATDEFIAQYYRGNPRVMVGAPYENPPIDHMSVLEWWTLDRAAGSSSKNITLYARTYSDATLLSELRVLRWDGTIWKNEGNTFSSGVAVGPVTSGLVSNFFAAGTATQFTFGSNVGYGGNPLPIHLIAFDATKLNTSQSSINWELSACCSPTARFEVQRAGIDKDFETIAIIGGSATSRFYNYTDNDLQKGINYYRLKMTNDDGTVSYSKIVAVLNGANGLILTSLHPAILTHSAALTVVSTAAQKVDIIIVDMMGRVVKRQNYAVSEGSSAIQLSAGELPAGAYLLTGMTVDSKTNTLRFIKQ